MISLSSATLKCKTLMVGMQEVKIISNYIRVKISLKVFFEF